MIRYFKTVKIPDIRTFLEIISKHKF